MSVPRADVERRQRRRTMPPSDACEKDCLTCIRQFKPGPYQFKPEEVEEFRLDDDAAQDQLLVLVDYLNKKREHISGLLNKHGDDILARWKKKTKTRREALLLEAFPEMYQQKWPTLRSEMGLGGQRTNYHEDGSVSAKIVCNVPGAAAVFPYFNVETLKEDPMRLLSLLHYRATSQPEDWVYFDALAMKSYWNSGQGMNCYNDSCVVMHGSGYGKLVPWEREQCHTWLQVGYPLAIAIIGHQDYLCEKLSSILDMLLSPGQLRDGNTEWFKLVGQGFRSSEKAALWSSCQMQAFSAPPFFDPQQALKSAEAFLAANVDDLWFLQTSPEYLQRYITSAWQVTKISGASGHSHWMKIAQNLLTQPPRIIGLFRYTIDLLQQIMMIQTNFKASAKPHTLRSRDYNEALSLLLDVCWHGTVECSHNLRIALPQTKAFMHNYEAVRTADGRHSVRHKRPQGHGDMLSFQFGADPLHYMLWRLAYDAFEGLPMERSHYMSWIDDYMANANHKERARVDQRLTVLISHLMFFEKLAFSIRAGGLEPGRFPRYYTDKSGPTRSMFERFKCGGDSSTPSSASMNGIAVALEDFHKNPWPKGKRDRNWLREASACRERLAKVWNICRNSSEQHQQQYGPLPEERKYQVDLLSANDTAEYQMEVEAERQAVLDQLANQTAANLETAFKVQTQWGDSEPDRFILPLGRAKQKTRPPVRPDRYPGDGKPEVDSGNPFSHPAAVKKSTIRVSYPSLLIFNKMFRSSEIAAQASGTIKWQQLVSAMANAGFAATSNGGGSAVTFEAESVGSIVFHRPHPDPEVDAIMLHNIGRRLTKWFGWEHGTFVEKEKE